MSSRIQDVIQRGTRASQPAATAVSAGTLYFVTDEGVTERSNGTSWESFSDTGVIASVVISAGAASGSRNSIVFSNSNGVSFGLNGSTITASHGGLTSQSNQALSAANGSFAFQTAFFSNGSNVSFSSSAGSAIYGIVATSLTNINLSAGAASANLSAFVFSNSNNVSFGLNGSTVTATVTVATSLTNIVVAANGTTNSLSQLVFSNSNSITFGLSDSTITASFAGGGAAAFTLRNWANPAAEYFVDMRTSNPLANKIIVMPMQLEGVLSGEYLRFPVSMQSNLNRTFGAVSANTTWSAARQDTIHLQLYTRGTGASSVSLFSVSNFSQGFTVLSSFQNGAASNEWSASLIATVGFGTTQTTFSTNYACTSNQYVINTANFGTVMDNTRWMEVPFNSSISPGNYYLGFARSTLTTKDAGGATGLSTTNFDYQIGVMSVTSGSIGRWGNNNNSIGLNFGMGNFTSNVQIISTDSFGTAQLLGTGAVAANIVPFMVL